MRVRFRAPAGSARRRRRPTIASLFGASSNVWGSPQAEFDIPYGNIGQNAGFAMYAQRYHDAFGWDERSRAKIASDQRASACVNPEAVFFGKPLTPDEVLASRVIASPLRMLEIVMPVTGGAAVVVTSLDRARRLPRRPVVITGFGEHLTHKTPTYAPSLDVTPIQQAARSTFAMAGRTPGRCRHGSALRLLHHHGAADDRGFGILRQGRGPGLREEP